MTKRLLSLTLAAILAMAVLIPSALAVDSFTMWVYTDDGKTLNVRSSESTGNNIVGRLNFGAQVNVLSIYNGWAMIAYSYTVNGYHSDFAYVQSRYLVNYNPGQSPSPAPVTPAGGTVAALNKEFRSARKAAVPYTVISRPSRASGWVNLRWAPSTDAEVIVTCPQGKELTVLAELTNWYQVQDLATGMVGFIMKKFVTAVR